MSFGSKKSLLEELKNKKFRDAYAAEHVKTSVPIQIYLLREQRHWNQSQLAERAKTTQTVISRLEDLDYGKLSISTLLKLASAFDIALLVKFVPFTRLLKEFKDNSPEALSAKSFSEELLDIAAWAEEEGQEESAEAQATPLGANNFARDGLIEMQKQSLPDQLMFSTNTEVSGAAAGALAQMSGAHLGSIFSVIGDGRYSSPNLKGITDYGTLERH
jgi:transcriptional regulator with XRE-family HTH domain